MELLIEFVVELVLEILLELGWTAVKATLGRRNHHPVIATLGYLVLGAVIGGVTVWWHPARLLSGGPFPGVSLIVAPLLMGGAMHVWGSYRRSHGHETTNLATFYGGAAFSLGLALVRFFWTH